MLEIWSKDLVAVCLCLCLCLSDIYCYCIPEIFSGNYRACYISQTRRSVKPKRLITRKLLRGRVCDHISAWDVFESKNRLVSRDGMWKVIWGLGIYGLDWIMDGWMDGCISFENWCGS